MKPLTLLKAIRDEKLFRPFFRDPSTWSAWVAVLKSIFGLALDTAEAELFQRCTGRTRPFKAPITEGWLICGRRSGKSFIAALVAVFLACFRDYRANLSPGERGVVMVLAVDKDQAGVIFRYVRAFITEVPLLARMVERETAESIDLTNRVSIEVHTSNYKSIRGRTVVAALCDEVAFWRSEDSRNPAEEVIGALVPAMATIPGALLLLLSSAYDTRNVLFKAFEKHHGSDDSNVLVWRAATQVMNPTIRPEVIAAEYERDPQSAAAEYGSEFRSDITGFLEEKWITDAIDQGRNESAPRLETGYSAFVDPSGGKGDSFTLAIAHKSKDGKEGEIVLDLAREFRPPFDPGAVVKEIAGLVSRYGLGRVVGDAYSAEWCASAFRAAGIAYEQSKLTRSEIYLESGPLLAQGRVRLIEQPRLIAQLRQLERRTAPGGRDRVNHPPGGHDDLANSAMGALHLASKRHASAVPWPPGPIHPAGKAWSPFSV